MLNAKSLLMVAPTKLGFLAPVNVTYKGEFDEMSLRVFIVNAVGEIDVRLKTVGSQTKNTTGGFEFEI